MKPRVIAFYLPQFHPFKENDEWWGKGFTEWTSVGKAKPLFKGHNQPRVPTELGYYDLRLPVVREQQAQMAQEAGVEGFCYWHYWFGNGKRLMADVFDEVLASGKPDFPFCLGWANHSWYSKLWNSDGSSTNKLLIEQTYPGIKDMQMHMEFLIRAFKDKRYIKINGKPLLYIFDTKSLPQEYIDYFIKRTCEEGFPGLYLVGRIVDNGLVSKEDLLIKKYSAVSYERLLTLIQSKLLRNMGALGHKISDKSNLIKGIIRRRPQFMTDYKKCAPLLITEKEKEENVIPVIVPQWDHTPRSGWNGSLFVNVTPEIFKSHVKDAISAVKHKPAESQIIFLKSWNEWGEGNMMEPDLTFGRGFIDALHDAIAEEME